MANEEHLAILEQGVEVWNQWRKDSPDVRPNLIGAGLTGACLNGVDLSEVYLYGANLKGADLSKTNLRGVYLYRANLEGANLTRTVLTRANLQRADLEEACLSEAYLFRVNLTRANLTRANLAESDLEGTYLEGADLSEARLFRANLSRVNLTGAALARIDLGEAKVGHTIFETVDLSTAKGLNTIEHRGPSTIGVSTIYKSKGNIPESFLRGAGVPDNFIEYMRSLAGQAVEYYSCFISYSSDDKDLAQRLYGDLQSAGVRCWFASEDMKIGEPILHRIDESIRMYEKLLLILSENAITSEWVDHEVQVALAKERRSSGHVLFPIRVDDAVMESEEGWAATVRDTRHIGDFTEWKDHDAYQQAFDRLLWGLKAEE